MATLVHLDLPVINPAAVLPYYDRIGVFRSTDGGNMFLEVTNPTTRIPLGAQAQQYEFDDLNGDATYQYAMSFFNSLTGAQSSLGDPITAAGDQALGVVSVADLKTNYLYGLDMTIGDGSPFPDSLFEYYIRAAIGYVERISDISILPSIIKNEVQDYFRPSSFSMFSFKTFLQPLLSVQAVRLNLPGMGTPYTYPANWLTVRQDISRITIYPQGGAFNDLPTGFGMTPYCNFFEMDVIPNALAVDYVAGFEAGKVPPDIVEVVAKISSYGPLSLAGDLIGGAGIASSSLSLDSLSQSISTTSSPMFSGYGARLANYAKEVAEQLPQIRKYYRGLSMTAL